MYSFGLAANGWSCLGITADRTLKSITATGLRTQWYVAQVHGAAGETKLALADLPAHRQVLTVGHSASKCTPGLHTSPAGRHASQSD